MGRIAGIALGLLVLGLVVQSQDGTAQDRDAERIAVLETQVAGLGYALSELGRGALPPPDPDGQWVGATYVYDPSLYRFDFICGISEMGADYWLRCTRPQPMAP